MSEEMSESMSEINGAKFYKNPSTAMMEEAMKNEHAGGVIFLESAHKGGKFVVPKKISVTQFISDSLELDFSVADFVFPTTEISIKDFLGGTRIKVPKGVIVQTKTMNFMSDQNKNLADTAAGDDAPRIVVKGITILGKLKVNINDDVPALTIVP